MPASKALEVYRRKRDFSKTIEPSGRAERETAKPEILRFVVHKHAARRLYYDFRLELEELVGRLVACVN
jgi:bifunctional non-homologous end joining protein LigD